MAIWTKWFPESGFEAVDAPYLEYYGEEFDGRNRYGRLPNMDTDQDITIPSLRLHRGRRLSPDKRLSAQNTAAH